MVQTRELDVGGEKSPFRSFEVIGHTYQPSREIFLPDGNVLQVVPEENEEIYQQCYRPVFVEGEEIPQGFTFSLYGPLREWMKQAHPDEFRQIQEKITRLPDKEYQVLGDPYIHAILPLLPIEDQDTLIKIGKQAFFADFGFEPKGIWLPETAVSYETLRLIRENGYEFVVLRDSQITNRSQNPMFVKLSDGDDLAVVHFDSALSGSTSFNEWATMNADNFLDYWIPGDREEIAIGTDTELYGHHRHEDVGFLLHLSKRKTLESHNLVSMSIKNKLASVEKTHTDVVENSSWSCEHNLGRWTGGCSCDGASDETNTMKHLLFSQLAEYNQAISRELDRLDPLWRDGFIDAFIDLRGKIFTGQDFLIDLHPLLAAKIYMFIGQTSCGWFFGKEDSPERAIPTTMVQAIKHILDREYSIREAA